MGRHANSVAIPRQVVERGVVKRRAVVPDRHRILRPVVTNLELVTFGDVLEKELEHHVYRAKYKVVS